MTPQKIALLTDSCADLPPEAAAEKMVRTALRIEPGGNVPRYAECFAEYQKLNTLLMPTFGGKS